MSTAQLTDHQVLELGATLRTARENQGKNISDAAYRIALSPSQLRALESGDRKPFYSDHYFLQAIARYAEFLGVSHQELGLDHLRAEPILAAESAITHTALANDLGHEEPVRELLAHASAAATPRSASIKTYTENPKRFGLNKLPALGLLGMGAAVIVLAAFMNMERSTPSANPTAVAQGPVEAAGSAPSPAAQESAAATSPPAQAAPLAPVAAPAVAPAVPTSSLKQNAGNGAGEKDSKIQSTASAWVQIVSKTGEKSNLRISASEPIDFASSQTSAVVIGKPEKATLIIRGKTIDLRQHASGDESSPRALVVLDTIRH